ncbi:MAG: hypothetical protein RIS75_1407 [Actinomycetota bacterium]
MTAKRLLFITGKGGTGKSSIAAGLGLAAANAGLRVLLIDVEQRHSFAPAFGLTSIPSTPTSVLTHQGSLKVLALDPTESLLSYLDKFYGLRMAGGLLNSMGAVDFATDIAPGLKDILLVGFACDAARSKKDNEFVYDLVIVDSPPTGRIEKFLTVADSISSMAPIGPINQQAQLVRSEMTAATTEVMVIVNPEELSITEAITAKDALTAAGIAVGPIVVNHYPTETPQEITDADLETSFTELSDALHDSTLASEVVRTAQQTIQKHRAGIALVAELEKSHATVHVPGFESTLDARVEHHLANSLSQVLESVRS